MVLWLKHDHHNIDISSQYVALTLCHDFSKNITYIYTIYFCNNHKFQSPQLLHLSAATLVCSHTWGSVFTLFAGSVPCIRPSGTTASTRQLQVAE